MAIEIDSAYSGEVLEQLLVRASTGNQLVAGGHIRVEANIGKKFSIPRLRAGGMLQKRKEDPTKTDSKGDFSLDEKYLEPKDVMAFTLFNPRVFEKFWRPYQPKGNLVFAELPMEAQNALLAEMAKVIDFELGGEFINGVYGENEGEFFDGILSRITASNTVVSFADAEAITSNNVLSVLKSVRDGIPTAIRQHPDLKIFMSIDDADIYDDVLTNLPTKGADYTGSNAERFKGVKIVPLAQWPKDVVVATVASTKIDSNLWAGVNYVDDGEVIQIDRYAPASELYFFKMLMKADTNIVFDEDIVLYDGRGENVGGGGNDQNPEPQNPQPSENDLLIAELQGLLDGISDTPTLSITGGDSAEEVNKLFKVQTWLYYTGGDSQVESPHLGYSASLGSNEYIIAIGKEGHQVSVSKKITVTFTEL